MKHLLFLFVGLFAISSCNNAEDFASLADETRVTTEPSEAPRYRRDIQALVQEEVESNKKISGKKRQTINVTRTVGDKNLGKKKKPKIITNIEVTNIVVEEDGHAKDDKKPKKPTSKKQTPKKKVEVQVEVKTDSLVSEGPEVDILFYMLSRTLDCVQEFNRPYTKGHASLAHMLLSHLDVNWQIAFSYYSEGEQMVLLPLELHNGTAMNVGKNIFKHESDYTLARGEYDLEKAKRLFYSTLMPFYPEHEGRAGNRRGTLNFNGVSPNVPNARRIIADPLSGLDHILSAKPQGVIRDGSQVIVFLLDYEFPYYSSQSWKQFFVKHADVSFVALSGRQANVSNLHWALERGYDFEYQASCNAEEVYNAIQSRVQ